MGWIAVEFEGTLFRIDRGFNGRPVPRMIERIVRWRNEGKDIRIITSRVDHWDIDNWCRDNLGFELPIVSCFDDQIDQIWHSKSIQFIPNIGIRIDGQA